MKDLSKYSFADLYAMKQALNERIKWYENMIGSHYFQKDMEVWKEKLSREKLVSKRTTIFAEIDRRLINL